MSFILGDPEKFDITIPKIFHLWNSNKSTNWIKWLWLFKNDYKSKQKLRNNIQVIAIPLTSQVPSNSLYKKEWQHLWIVLFLRVRQIAQTQHTKMNLGIWRQILQCHRSGTQCYIYYCIEYHSIMRIHLKSIKSLLKFLLKFHILGVPRPFTSTFEIDSF